MRFCVVPAMLAPDHRLVVDLRALRCRNRSSNSEHIFGVVLLADGVGPLLRVVAPVITMIMPLCKASERHP